MAETQNSNWETLVEFVNERLSASRVPGIAVGIFHDGEVTAEGFGVTNVDHPLSVTSTTLFQIGSITKTFTGTLIMRLVEQGKLELDAPIRTYLPDFQVVDPDVSAQATVRHLMTHTSGWEGDLFLDTGPGDDAATKYVAAMAKQAQLAPIGKYWSYNNAGFGVLGALIEVLNDATYEQVLKSQLLEPLGMTEAYLRPTDVMTRRFVVGHSATADKVDVMTPWPLARSADAMGGLITDVHHLLRYARYHMGDAIVASAPIISAESVKKMQSPQVTIIGEEKWGLTWGLEELDGVQIVSHTGGTTGQITRLMLIPERHFAIAVFTNAQQGGAVGKAIAERALELYLDLKRPTPIVQESSRDALASFAGFYQNAFSEMEIGVLNGRLIGQLVIKGGFPTQESAPPPPPPPVTIGIISDERLMMLDGGFKNQLIDIVRTPDGEIGWLRMGGRLYRKQ